MSELFTTPAEMPSTTIRAQDARGSGRMTEEKIDPRIWALTFILADAEGDTELGNKLLDQLRKENPAPVAAIVALARIAAESLQIYAGDAWEDALKLAVMGLAVDAAVEEERS